MIGNVEINVDGETIVPSQLLGWVRPAGIYTMVSATDIGGTLYNIVNDPDRYYQVYLERGWIFMLAATTTLAVLEHGGYYETAYKGIDDLDNDQLRDSKGWADLKMSHATNFDWIDTHSVHLT